MCAYHDAATDIHMVQLHTPWEEVVESIIESGHTRVPFTTNRAMILPAFCISRTSFPDWRKAPGESPVACRTVTEASICPRDKTCRRSG